MILVAAGSSLPFCGIDSQQIVLSAFFALGRIAKITAQSSLYRSPAWPDPSDPAFVNAVVAIESQLSPESLLASLHAIETGFGRQRHGANTPRTLDLDLIAYGNLVMEGPPKLPHPRFADRDFVLIPIQEIAPEWRSPSDGSCIGEMIAALDNIQAVRFSS